MYCAAGKLILTNLSTDEMNYSQLPADVVEIIKKENGVFELIEDQQHDDLSILLAGNHLYHMYYPENGREKMEIKFLFQLDNVIGNDEYSDLRKYPIEQIFIVDDPSNAEQKMGLFSQELKIEDEHIE